MRKGHVIGSLCFVAVLTSNLSGAPDEAIKIEVEQPQLSFYEVQSPTINASLKLTIDARFTNEGNSPVEIPDHVGALHVAGISMHGVESQNADGSWRIVEGGGDIMWIGDIVFPKCKLLNPKETLEVKGISGPFVVFKSHLEGLSGTKATVRLYLFLPCTQRDGKLGSKILKTIPFVLSVPSLP